MKKIYLLMAAALAIMLTACSSEDDVVQNNVPQAAAQEAVGFDVYMPTASNVTRAGLTGTMTTNRLQRSEAKGGGFGVYAFLIEDGNADAGYGNAYSYLNDNGVNHRTTPMIPNFMVNEKLLWNPTNQGWYYNPLKYWPNETDNDSQNSKATMETAETPYSGSASRHIDRLTFFAYAPYVPTGSGSTGITKITDKAGLLGGSGSVIEPSIEYATALTDPNDAVDLLWGVAPAGGLSYTAVNGTTVNVPEGQPLIDMTKPNVNTNMKFLFQHALARIGIKAVAAIDQIGAGGVLDPNTRITINKIKLTGYFGETGLLNLDNDNPNVANWRKINDVDITSSTVPTAMTRKDIVINADKIATHLRYVPDAGTPAKHQPQLDRVGVTTVRQNVLEPNNMTKNPDWFTTRTFAANELAYSETTPYYKGATTGWADDDLLAFTMPESYTVDSKGVYTKVAENSSFKYPKVLENYKKATAFTKIDGTTEKAENYGGYQAYTKVDASGSDPEYYKPKTGAPATNDYVVKEGIYFYKIPNVEAAKTAYNGEQMYTKSSDEVYNPEKIGTVPTADMYVLCGNKTKYVPVQTAETTVRMRDANYFMVIPTNNVELINKGLTDPQKEALRTIRVEIEYYITTEDKELNDSRAQTKNVITKDVVFPSLANGKSYNLNLVLGLTSVKMEAEVDDWKVINVNADLPQNTAE